VRGERADIRKQEKAYAEGAEDTEVTEKRFKNVRV
jgi:hypothetical protein